MHERTERAVARLLFVFCCAVPTAVVILAIMVSWTPWYQARRLAQLKYVLGRETGLVVEIESCRRTAPGTYELNDVRLSDPDSGREIATVRSIDYYSDEQKTGIELHHPVLQSAGLGVSWSKLHDRLISNPQHTMIPIRIVASRLTIESRTGPLALKDINATVEPETDGVRMVAEARDDSLYGEAILRFTLFRDRNVKHNGRSGLPETEAVFSTEGTSLPCSALAEYSPLAKRLGQDAMFSGEIRCRQSPDGWQFDFGGTSLSQVDLADFSELLPHPLRGTANVQFDRGYILPSQSVDVVGTIHSQNIGVQSDLLLALHHRLELDIETNMDEPPYGFTEFELATHFNLQDSVLKLTGICDAMESNVAMRSSRGIIVRTPTETVPADQVTAAINPSRRTIDDWNKVFLPSSLPVNPNAAPAIRIGKFKDWSGGPTIRQ